MTIIQFRIFLALCGIFNVCNKAKLLWEENSCVYFECLLVRDLWEPSAVHQSETNVCEVTKTETWRTMWFEIASTTKPMLNSTETIYERLLFRKYYQWHVKIKITFKWLLRKGSVVYMQNTDFKKVRWVLVYFSRDEEK